VYCPEFESRWKEEFFFLFHNVHTDSGAPPSLLFSGNRGFLLGVNRDLHTHLHVEKNVWRYTFTLLPLPPPIYLHGLDSEHFNFILYFNNLQLPFLSTRFPTCFVHLDKRKTPYVGNRRPLFSPTILIKSFVQIPFFKASCFFQILGCFCVSRQYPLICLLVVYLLHLPNVLRTPALSLILGT
jgi:hypothetical protein